MDIFFLILSEEIAFSIYESSGLLYSQRLKD